MPLEKITVKELADLAFINKATFYAHYKDIYDLAEQLEDEAVDKMIAVRLIVPNTYTQIDVAAIALMEHTI